MTTHLPPDEESRIIEREVEMGFIHCVGWGGTTRKVLATFQLGSGRKRCTKRYGIRRAIWDAAFGYVSGFRKRDILYFVLTRSLSRQVWAFVAKREGKLQ
jgi:hypothetical protein